VTKILSGNVTTEPLLSLATWPP